MRRGAKVSGIQTCSCFLGGLPGKNLQSRTRNPKLGTVPCRGAKVSGIQAFGCFVEALPGKEALVHVSELALERVDDPAADWKIGDEIDVMCVGVFDGKVKLSRWDASHPAGSAADLQTHLLVSVRFHMATTCVAAHDGPAQAQQVGRHQHVQMQAARFGVKARSCSQPS